MAQRADETAEVLSNQTDILAPIEAGRSRTRPKNAPEIDRQSQPRRRDTTPLGITDQALVDALRRSGKPTAVSELRTLLEISETVGRERVRRVLTDATDRGIIGRSGVRGGVRYFLP